MKKIINLVFFFFIALNWLSAQSVNPKVEGELKKWHKVTLSFKGEEMSENDAINPFLNYRLNVTFENNNKVYTIPGFYAADGNAAESSADKGAVWKVRFTPDEIGEWTYSGSFRKGDQMITIEKIWRSI